MALAWMLFMQPALLKQQLAACGIEKPDASLWSMWREGLLTEPNHRLYVTRCFVLLYIAMPVLTFGGAGVLPLLDVHVDWSGVVAGVVGGMLAGVVYGLTSGIGVGVGVGVVVGAIGGVVGGIVGGVLASVVLGAGVVYNILTGAIDGVVFGLAFVRLPIYLVESIHQAILHWRHGNQGVSTLRWSPVMFHELSLLPYPTLEDHIVSEASANPNLAHQALDACAFSKGQRKAGQRALARLQALELKQQAQAHRFTDVIELQGKWMPGVQGAPLLLLAFRDAARYLAAAQNASAYHSLQHLEGASKALSTLDLQMKEQQAKDDPLAHALPPTFEAWRRVVGEMRSTAEEQARHRLPNPFKAGTPLTPESGHEVFRGRDAEAKRIGMLLTDPSRSASLVLLGPRRCGKTSLLRMLPAMLPDALCVFFDLQNNPTSSPRGFFEALAREARLQAQDDRRMQLPPLPEGPAFESARAWLDALEGLADDRRILLCIDEFERLEDSFPGDRSELMRLMGLLRGTIQHKRKVRLLISGVAPFDELDTMWYDHFISTREIHLDHLDEPTSVALLTKPAEVFPDGAISAEVARAIFERTGGQPFLLQLYGSLLVDRLNDEERESATLEDLEDVEADVLEQAKSYFGFTWNATPPAARVALEQLAEGAPSPDIDRESRRWLKRRGLVDGEDGLRVPVLGRWIRER